MQTGRFGVSVRPRRLGEGKGKHQGKKTKELISLDDNELRSGRRKTKGKDGRRVSFSRWETGEQEKARTRFKRK